jgi:hypothetical protein
MIIKELYKTHRPDGGVDVSPIKSEGEYELMYRIIADEGKLVTRDGENLYPCIDTETNEGWYEINDPSWMPERDEIV